MLQRLFASGFGLCTLRGNKLVLHTWHRLKSERLAKGGSGASLIDWREGGRRAHNVHVTEEGPYRLEQRMCMNDAATFHL